MSTAKPHRNPPFRAEHLGSLLRPDDLKEVRTRFANKEATEADLKPVTEKAIKTAVDKQLQLGYHAITDGEYNRHQFWGTWFPSLEGMKAIYDPPLEMFRTYVPDLAAFIEAGHNPGESIICSGKIRHTGKSVYVPEFEYVKSLVPESYHKEIKLTLPAPEWYHLRYKDGEAYPSDVYKNDEEYFADIAKAYNKEIDLLYEAGCRNVQIDDPNMAYFCSEKMREGWKTDEKNTKSCDELFQAYVELYNDCLRTVKEDMHVGLHLCRGNFVKSRHFSEGGYDVIAKELFNKLNVNTYYLEYDTPRAGTFEPLRHLPKHKNAILGVVTSKFPKLEDKAEMVARVHSASKIVADGAGQSEKEALQRLGVSPQCGFASHEIGNAIEWDDMWKKLELVKSIAQELWPGEP